MFIFDSNDFQGAHKNRPAYLGGEVPRMRASYDLDDDELDDPADDFPLENDEPGDDFDDDFDEDFEDEYDEDYEDMNRIDDDEEVEEEADAEEEDEFADVDGSTTFIPEGEDIVLADIVTEDEIEEENPEDIFSLEEEEEEFDDFED